MDSEAQAGETVDRPAGDAGFRVAPLYGRHALLRVVAPEDYRFLRTADHGGELSVRWRLRGATASPEQWAQRLWQGVLAQYMVVGVSDPSPLGLVVAYNANFQDGYAYLAAERFGRDRRVPVLMFGLALFIDYVFSCWNFHKLYVETAEYNAVQFQSGIGRFFQLEARLRDHLYFDGRRWDQLVLALYRDTWQREGEGLLAAARPAAEERAFVRLPSRGEDER